MSTEMMIDESTRSEAARVLQGMLGKTTGHVPPELIVEHILSVTAEADWPVTRAAGEAMIRRLGFARRDELRVADRPARAEPFGLYVTRQARSSRRPYATTLECLRPIVGSCDCPDFLLGSLGLCKHLLTVLEHLAARPKVFERVLMAPDPRHAMTPRARLIWDPIRPMLGPGDGLDRLRLAHPNAAMTKRLARARAWFTTNRGDGPARLTQTYADRPLRRLAMVEDLLSSAGRRATASSTVRSQPAVRALLERERSRLQTASECRQARHRGHADVRGLRRKLHPYQRQGVDRFIERGQLLLADDMGLGKTIQAAAACHALWHAGRVRRGLVVVPASLKDQWSREWQATTDVPAEIVDGPPHERARVYRQHDARFLIVNYEQVLRDLAQLDRFAPDIVVLDEAQRIKNWSTKTARSIKQLRPRYRLVLTGTPMENRLDELASIVEWVDAFALEPKWRLAPWHTVAADGRKGVVGARHLDTLRARLAPCMIRRVRHEVLDQLPPRTDTVVPVPITAAQAELHDDLIRPIAALMRTAERRPLTQPEFIRLMSLLTTQRIIANGLAQLDFTNQWPTLSAVSRPGERLLRSLDSPKLIELREMLSQLVVAEDRKVVVFSQWRRMLRLAEWAVRDVLGAARLRSAFFTGREGQRRRTQNLVDFHDDPTLRVLFATDAGGVGLNLQRAADCCINLDLPWNPAVLEQRIGRIHRLGQDRPVNVYTFVSQNSIEERIAAVIDVKKALFDGLFDGERDEVQFDQAGTFIGQVARLLAPDTTERATGDDDNDDDVERDVDGLVAASDETQDVDPAVPLELVEPKVTAEMRAAGSSLPVHEALAALSIERTTDGGLRIEAPRHAAETLAGLFGGLAHLLAPLAGPGGDVSDADTIRPQ